MEIPDDIWIYIARFLAPQTLRGLYSVNRVFFELAFDERYRDISFVQIDSRSLRKVQRLMDPFVAKRVRRLRINPVWFKDAETTNLPFNDDSDVPGCFQGVQLSVPSLVRSLSTRLQITQKPLRPLHRIPRELIHQYSNEIISGFTNVISFVIVTRWVPHPKNLLPFLAGSWNTFGASLRKITLNAPLGEFQALLPPADMLVCLEELTLRFVTDMSRTDADADTNMLKNVIVPFVNQFSTRLLRLNIMSSALGDHSCVFLDMNQCPNLTSLSLDIAFYPPLLSKPEGLTKVLRDHADNLQHVRLQSHESFRLPSREGTSHDFFCRWMQEIVKDDDILANLQSLVIEPTNDLALPSSLETALPLIQRSCDSLTTLILTDRCLKFEDVTTLAKAFAHRPPMRGLKNFHVKTVSLNPQLFDMFAENLKGLDDLQISFLALLSDVKKEGIMEVDDEATDATDIKPFLKQMEGRLYPNWHLYSLWVWQLSHMTTQLAHNILSALTSSIPSLRMFHRADHANWHALFN
ncbi:hypothetical protein BDN72DRAFT_849063 [Pluteus cervinus]|uniref:Uncharacterized protein n=1 Tax=Pluteus cervinus TaxID=181527 RepID=A0ACD3A8P2_9AGAR|nr:hypothetical protein BDN72DRAFT_849063 [Pluteus cervinus]